MPTLLKSLKRPHTWLVILLLVASLSLADAWRAPADQVTARLYIHSVHLYQHLGRPLIIDRVRCRYRPTCSEYSIAAVQRYGIRAGLIATIRRLRSCTPDVPMGTYDPVR
jgi:putative membrane protein insertion efficiency factor